MNESMFVQAVGLARSGKKSEARDLFQQVLKVDRTNEMAWLWYAECMDTLAERRQALETCIRLNPQSHRVRLRLSALQQGNPPDNDVGRTQPVVIGSKKKDPLQKDDKEISQLSPEDEWVLSDGSAIFTVSPERVASEEFTRIQESTEAFLLKNPEMKPVYRRTEDWSEINTRPSAAREPRTRPRKQNGMIPRTGSKKPDRHTREAVFALVLVTLMFALLAGAAIMLRVL
jgi:hypothetical protein